MTFRTSDGDRDKFDHSLHHYTAKKFDHSSHYYPQKIIYPEQKYYETKKLECDSLYFNGTSSYINCGNDLTFNITNKITIIIELNAMIFTGDNRRLCGTGTDTYQLGIDSSGLVRFDIRNNAGILKTANSNFNLLRNTPYIIIADYDETNIKININNTDVTLTPITQTDIKSSIGKYFEIARRPVSNDDYFKGSIKQVVVYNRNLSQIEMLKVNQYKKISQANLVLDLPLKTDYSGNTVIKDLSGNNNDGTLTDCEWNCEWIREKHKVI